VAGYSGKPLPRKLGVKAGHRIALRHAPPGFASGLGPLPEGVELVDLAGSPLDLVLLFCSRAAVLAADFARAAASLSDAGMLWVAWPKRASGVATDLTGDRVREHGLAAGLVDVKVCAIDETWSGLKFVRRLKDRGAAPRR
jgi:hypothetical protein